MEASKQDTYTKEQVDKFNEMKGRIRYEMKSLYKVAKIAFSEMDFNGKGYIEQDDFFNLLNFKLPYSKEEINEFFAYEKLFSRLKDGHMPFELFKKEFFPEAARVPSKDGIQDEELKLDTNLDAKAKSDIVVNRMKRIENLLKEKFSNNYVSIRKAFLDIDMDYDGFITAEDIARQFGKDNQKLDFRDLRTLIKNRDSKRKGRIDFKDFCRWMGGAIKPTETFFFRHDSVRNPQYEDNLERQSKNHGTSREKVLKNIMNSNLMKRILDKISTQWKTLKKAFSDLNQGKNGWISEIDLKKYLVNWGFNTTDEQFKEFYEFLDYDKDGHITYEDFKNSVGSVISPIEHLYFRQDIPPQKLVTSKNSNYWEDTEGVDQHSSMKKKIRKDKTILWLTKVQNQITMKGWKELEKCLKDNCSKTTMFNISTEKFFKIMQKFKINFTQREKDDLVECFNLKDEGITTEINIRLIFELSRDQEINKIYKQIDLEKREEEELSMQQQRLMPISEDDLLKILSKKSNMKELWREVRKYDGDSNGFLTLSELNSIFFQLYPDLAGKSLFKIFRPFTSIQNKSLVDYKRLKEYLEFRMETFSTPNPLEKAQNLIKQQNQTGVIENQIPIKTDAQHSPRDVRSPSMKRMEQIKDEILKAAQGSPLMQNSGTISKNFVAKSPEIGFPRKSKVEALVSPRGNKKILPQLESIDFKTHARKTSRNLFSPGRASIGSKFSQYSTFSAPFFSKSNDTLKQKLGYEWKNIYRSLNAVDLNSSGYVTKNEFSNCVHNNGVFLSRDELAKLFKKFSNDGEVNYVRISNELGLHKNSYDYMKSSSKYLKNATILKSMHGGLNDSKSQLGDL